MKQTLAQQRFTQIYRYQKQSVQKMCQTKDPLIRQQLEDSVEKYMKNLLKLTRKTKANHYKINFPGKQINSTQKLGKYMGND